MSRRNGPMRYSRPHLDHHIVWDLVLNEVGQVDGTRNAASWGTADEKVYVASFKLSMVSSTYTERKARGTRFGKAAEMAQATDAAAMMKRIIKARRTRDCSTIQYYL